MKIRSLDMSDFNLGSKVYWWVMVAAGSAITLASLAGLGSLSSHQWLELFILAGLVILASRHPLDIPNVKASVSVSDVFIFLGLFYLGTGPAVLLGSIDNFISARRRAKRATSWILAPNLMAITVLLSATAFDWTLKLSLGRRPASPVSDDEISFLAFFPALVALGLVQYLANGWLVAWFYARRAAKPVYAYWRDGYLWTSWAFFASAITAGIAYCSIERYGLFHVAVALPVIVASYLTYKIYFERVTEKTRHIEQMNRLHLSTVEALASAIDAKDQTTHGHVRRVQIYAEGIAKLFNLSDAEIEALKAGALLHDIGKLAVPDYILNKPGKLTPAEFEKMKVHT
ncbi:MAG TPA: HD domain-containing phosphohydrolase, partial [Blastocatellia bacterium]|nr:HD domain-containing phosphohydrolase [Blastocatellia bacterium]